MPAKNQPKIAAIDIGSNSVHLVIAQMDRHGQIQSR